MAPWSEISAAGGHWQRLERKIVESARQHLGDEQVRIVFRGQTRVSPVLVPLIAPALFFLVKPRTVIVTDQSVITVQESMWVESKVTRLVSRHARGSVPVRRTRLGVKVGDEPTIFATPASLGSMSDTVAIASGASA